MKVEEANDLPAFTTYTVDTDSTGNRLAETVNSCCLLLDKSNNEGLRIVFKIGKAVSFYFALKERIEGRRPTWAEVDDSGIFTIWYVMLTLK